MLEAAEIKVINLFSFKIPEDDCPLHIPLLLLYFSTTAIARTHPTSDFNARSFHIWGNLMFNYDNHHFPIPLSEEGATMETEEL